MSQPTKIIWVPPSTSKTITFPWKEESKALYTAFYEPEMTNGKVSLEEINKFISVINSKCKLYKKESECDCFGFFVMITIILDLSLFFAQPRDNFFGIFTNGEAILLTWFLWGLTYLLCGSLCGYQAEADFQSQMREKFQDMLDRENAILRDRNLKWHLPDEFPHWIELTKDMKKNNDDVEIPYPVPQATETTIIFPRRRYKSKKTELPQTWRFYYDFFSPDMTAEKISIKEVQKLFSEIDVYLRVTDKRDGKMTLLFFLYLGLPLFVLLYVCNHFPDFLTTLQIMIIALNSLCVSLLLWFRKWEKEEKKREDQRRAGSQSIVDKYNKTLENKGLKWQLPDLFPLWIELCKSPHDNPRESIELLRISSHKRSNSFSVSPQDDAEAQRQNDLRNNARKSQNDIYAPLLEDEH